VLPFQPAPFSNPGITRSSAARNKFSYTTFAVRHEAKVKTKRKFEKPGASVNTIAKNKNRISLGILIVTSWLCMTACSTPQFQKAEVPEDLGLVYFYRPKKSFNADLEYAVRANGFEINTLSNGCYFTYIAKPGRIQFSARNEITNYLTLDVEPGQIYYIKGTTRPGSLIARPHLHLILSEAAENEIALCRPTNEDKAHNADLPPRPDKSKKESAIK